MDPDYYKDDRNASDREKKRGFLVEPELGFWGGEETKSLQTSELNSLYLPYLKKVEDDLHCYAVRLLSGNSHTYAVVFNKAVAFEGKKLGWKNESNPDATPVEVKVYYASGEVDYAMKMAAISNDEVAVSAGWQTAEISKVKITSKKCATVTFGGTPTNRNIFGKDSGAYISKIVLKDKDLNKELAPLLKKDIKIIKNLKKIGFPITFGSDGTMGAYGGTVINHYVTRDISGNYICIYRTQRTDDHYVTYSIALYYKDSVEEYYKFKKKCYKYFSSIGAPKGVVPNIEYRFNYSGEGKLYETHRLGGGYGYVGVEGLPVISKDPRLTCSIAVYPAYAGNSVSVARAVKEAGLNVVEYLNDIKIKKAKQMPSGYSETAVASINGKKVKLKSDRLVARSKNDQEKHNDKNDQEKHNDKNSRWVDLGFDKYYRLSVPNNGNFRLVCDGNYFGFVECDPKGKVLPD